MYARRSDFHLVCAIAVTALLACGGATESSDSEVGGATGVGSATSGGANPGSGGASNGGAIVSYGGCCAAMTPYCRDGYFEIPSIGDCPTSASCYTEPAWCCDNPRYFASIAGSMGGIGAGGATGSAATGNVGAATGAGGATGSAATGNTGAVTALGGKTAGGAKMGIGGACSAPTCAAGYVKSATFPSCDISTPVACHTVTGCGLSITCVSSYIGCDRMSQDDLRYTFADVTKCRASDIICASGTTRFDNECGCGCAQPATCPSFVNCMPGSGELDPLCTDPATCPCTTRAL